MVGAPSERHSLCLPEHNFRVVIFNDNDNVVVGLDTLDVIVVFERGVIVDVGQQALFVRQSVLLPLWRAPAGRLQQPHRFLGVVAGSGCGVAMKKPMQEDIPCQEGAGLVIVCMRKVPICPREVDTIN